MMVRLLDGAIIQRCCSGGSASLSDESAALSTVESVGSILNGPARDAPSATFRFATALVNHLAAWLPPFCKYIVHALRHQV